MTPLQGRLTVGDPLRALAALTVLVFHSAAGVAYARGGSLRPYGDLTDPILSLSRGVWLFFALSGYLLARPFMRWALSKGPSPSVGRYAVNRLLRIVPAFWVAVVLTGLILGGGQAGLKGWIATLGFWQTRYPNELGNEIIQAWTLHVEMVFYVTMPLAIGALAWLARGRVRPRTTAVVMLALLTVVGVASLAHRAGTAPSGHGAQQFVAAVGGFCPGMALAIVELTWGDRLRGSAWARLLVPALLLAAAGSFVAFVVGGPLTQRWDWLVVIASGLLLAAVLVRQWSGAPPWRALDRRPLHWIGKRSYSVYLLHNIVVAKAVAWTALSGSVPIGVEFAVVAALTSVLTLAAAAISFRFVERPFLERRLPWRSDPRADAAAHPSDIPEAQPAQAPV